MLNAADKVEFLQNDKCGANEERKVREMNAHTLAVLV